jgi:hypothetical protein
MKKVTSGEPLRIPAETFNTFVDAARDFQSRQRSRSASRTPERMENGIVPVRNGSGAASTPPSLKE